MRRVAVIAWSLALAALPARVAHAGPEDVKPLQGGVRLEVDGKPIDVSVGHAAPFVVDWDGDGRLDLLVGEFGGGTVRHFRNVGAKGAPRLEAAGVLQAGGVDASVPAG